MLEDTKDIYIMVCDAANLDWLHYDKNQLVRDAAQITNTTKREPYVAAIMLKYWGRLLKFCNRCAYAATPEDVHGWLVDSVLYALNVQPWLKETSSLYGNPKAPDITINRAFECCRLTYYQQLNRYNRKINSGISSLDSLTEDYKDCVAPTYEDEYGYYSFFVVHAFRKKDYFLAYIIDFITNNGELFKSEVLNTNLLARMLKHISDSEAHMFSERYGIPVKDVQYSLQFLRNASLVDIKKKIDYNLIKLQRLYKEGD